MEIETGLAQYSALDGALLGGFFISYSVLALVQINNLYNGRFLLFAGLAACAGLIATGLGRADFSGFCADGPSVIVCGGTGRGLTALGMVWLYVSGAMLVLFGVAQAIRALRSR